MNPEEINRRLANLLSQADTNIDALIGRCENELIRAYKHSLDEIRLKIAKMFENHGDKATYSDLTKYNRLTNLESEITAQLKSLNIQCTKTISDTIKFAYQESYYSAGYSLESTLGVKIGFGQLNPDVVKASVLNPLDRITWIARAQGHLGQLNMSIQQIITQGLIQGQGMAVIARGIKEKTGIATYKALRIARTEGLRAQSAARLLAYDKSEAAAESLGMKTERVWVATLDERTRGDHAYMDQKSANKEGIWEFPNGVTTSGPRLSGAPEEDINCRCTTKLVIITADGERLGKQKYKDYADWAYQKGIKFPAVNMPKNY